MATATSSARSASVNTVMMLEKVKKVDKDLDNLLSSQPIIIKLERQSGIKKTHMVYGLVGVILFFLLFQVATVLVLSLALFGYPLIVSLEAVESHDKAKDAHILSYWSVIATLQLSEVLLPFIKTHIPFYALAKLVFAVWMYLPQTKVSEGKGSEVKCREVCNNVCRVL
jgi:hypothetical protein